MNNSKIAQLIKALHELEPINAATTLGEYISLMHELANGLQLVFRANAETTTAAQEETLRRLTDIHDVLLFDVSPFDILRDAKYLVSCLPKDWEHHLMTYMHNAQPPTENWATPYNFLHEHCG